jgi:hypothetical protein
VRRCRPFFRLSTGLLGARAKSGERSVETPFKVAQLGRRRSGVIDLLFAEDASRSVLDY